MRTAQQYLRAYHKKQEQILLVYRPSNKHGWADRVWYLGEGYDQEKQYNHRLILENEVVIEFDDEDPQKNEEYAKVVSQRLKQDKIKHSAWDSGGKSIHIHFFLNSKRAGNIRLLKKVVMRHYTEGLPIKPDMRLAANSHLIRMEFGLHEASGRRKRPIYTSRSNLEENCLPDVIWQKYANMRTTVIRRQASKSLAEANCSCINYIANTVEFRENDDGRERALFVLIHTLKEKYEKESLTEFLQDWYKYSGGYKLSPEDVAKKVSYHYNRTYGTYTMVKELLEELGRENVLNECEVHKA